MDGGPPGRDPALNVLGQPLLPCSQGEPLTGFYRDGDCSTGSEDAGRHVVCARMTEEFLQFSFEQGNDLITPRAHLRFPGLRPGDRWCLCALRWKEALHVGKAPPVYLLSTHQKALTLLALEDLKRYALDWT